MNVEVMTWMPRFERRHDARSTPCVFALNERVRRTAEGWAEAAHEKRTKTPDNFFVTVCRTG
jgi:hypothetical protein